MEPMNGCSAIDITRPLSRDTEPWPGDAPFRRTEVVKGEWTISRLRMSAHSGTHMDAPLHRIPGGASIDMIPLSRMVLPAIVCDSVPEHCRGVAVLLTCSVTGTGASELVDRGAELVGTAEMSIDRCDCDDAHLALLGAGIPVVENLLLEGVEHGRYTLVCLPLRIVGGDGSPVRAILFRN